MGDEGAISPRALAVRLAANVVESLCRSQSPSSSVETETTGDMSPSEKRAMASDSFISRSRRQSRTAGAQLHPLTICVTPRLPAKGTSPTHASDEEVGWFVLLQDLHSSDAWPRQEDELRLREVLKQEGQRGCVVPGRGQQGIFLRCVLS